MYKRQVAYPQQAYAEETVNNQGNEQYLSEDNYEGPKEQNDSGQEEKEIQKTDEKLEDSLEIQQQEEKSSITESDDMENQQTAESAFEESESQDPTLTYRVHVSNVGSVSYTHLWHNCDVCCLQCTTS